MKALSIRQPWVWAILHAGKRIENRERADGRMPDICRHRGPLLLHASKTCKREDYANAATWMHEKHLATPIEWRLDRQHADVPKIQALSTLRRGGIIGIANAVGHIDPSGQVYGKFDSSKLDRRWHARGSYGLILADVRALPFVPCGGMLGIFDVPDHLVPSEAFR